MITRASFFLAVFFCSLILSGLGQASAETMFIKPSSEVPLRRGQGVDYKILAILPDGKEVNLLEESDSWARISTEDGKEGWILKRYLTRDKPLDELVASLKAKNKELEEQLATLQQEKDSFLETNTQLNANLEQKDAALESLNESYDTLRDDSADIIAIKKDLEQSKSTLATLQEQLNKVTAEKDRLARSQNIKWFLAGGGTLIIGFLFGLSSSRAKRKRSSLY